MSLPQTLKNARKHQQAGNYAEAERIYRGLLADDENIAAAWHGLGLVAVATGQHPPAFEHLIKAVQMEPDNEVIVSELQRLHQATYSEARFLATPPASELAQALNDQGIALAKAGRLEEALAVFQQAIQLQVDHANAHNNMSNVLKRLGRNEEANQAILQAISQEPTSGDLHLNRGHLLRQQGRLRKALVSYRHACRFQPDNADAYTALGAVLFDLGQAEWAAEAYSHAVALAPQDGEVHNGLGNVFRQLNRGEEAEACYRHALKCNPNLMSALANLGNMLAEEGKTAEARQAYQHAYRTLPLTRLRVLFETTLPIIYDSVDHVQELRQQFTDNLRQLEQEGVRVDPTQELMPTQFYLPYQGFNDRDVMATVARLGQGERRLDISPRKLEGTGKIRIGFLSRYLRTHTIGQLNYGLIQQLSRDSFEVNVLSLGPPDRDLGQQIAQSADRFYMLPAQLNSALRMVAALGLDILYYPDIGMDTQTYTMAFSRLAPVQCAGWGHPVTTGLPTMDYFISSEVEIPEADEHYTEKLIRLPRLAVYYEKPVLSVSRADRAQFDFPEHAHLYACPQTLFKVHPQFDEILAGILSEDPDGMLIMIEGKYPYWTEMLKRRFSRTMPDVANRIRFLPHLSRPDFLNLLHLVDVLLDPIHFGGGNTSYEGFALGVPIVTLPSQFLRGRLTGALYRQMDFTDLIAEDSQDYVRLAVQLGTDPEYRRATRRSIVEKSDMLFADNEAVKAMEKFWLEAVQQI